LLSAVHWHSIGVVKIVCCCCRHGTAWSGVVQQPLADDAWGAYSAPFTFASRKREAGRGVFYLLFLLAYAFTVPITSLT
jgi:hypothetical protein